MDIDRQTNDDAPKTYEFQLIHKKGHRVWGLLSGTQIIFNGKPAGLISVIDVSQQKKVEQQLKEQASRMDAIVSALPDILIVSNKNGDFFWKFMASII